jgi:hypothetical protein
MWQVLLYQEGVHRIVIGVRLRPGAGDGRQPYGSPFACTIMQVASALSVTR